MRLGRKGRGVPFFSPKGCGPPLILTQFVLVVFCISRLFSSFRLSRATSCTTYHRTCHRNFIFQEILLLDAAAAIFPRLTQAAG